MIGDVGQRNMIDSVAHVVETPYLSVGHGFGARLLVIFVTNTLARVESTVPLLFEVYSPVNCIPSLHHMDSPSFRELSLMRCVSLQRWRTPPNLSFKLVCGGHLVMTNLNRKL